MAELKTTLKKLLRNAPRIAFLGVGSELRQDDAAGVLIVKHLCKTCPRVVKKTKFKFFIGDTAPENLTGEIKRFNPTHIIIIDSAQISKTAGAAKLIDPDKIGGFSSSTHSLPLKIMTDYLVKSLGCQIAIIGISPKFLGFGACLSKEVAKSIERLSQLLREIIEEFH